MPQPLERTIHDRQEWELIHREGLKYLTNYARPFKITMSSDLDRTSKQNRFIHAVFKQIAGKLGRDAAFWKAYCKEKLGKKIVHFDLNEQPFVEVVSTTKYSTKDISELFLKIQAHFKQEYNTDITEPNEDEIDG